MRRPPIIAILTLGAGALGLVAPAAAQSAVGQTPAPSSASAAGLRYLSWPGRTYRPAPAPAPAPSSVAPVSTPAADLHPAVEASPSTAPVRPPIIPRGGYSAAARPSSVEPRQGLTPASAWIGSQAPAYAPQPVAPLEGPGPQPYFAAAPAPAPAPWTQPPAAAPAPAPAPAAVPTGYFAETAPIVHAAAPVPAAPAPAPISPPSAPAAYAAATEGRPAPVVEAAPAAAVPDPAAYDPMAPRRDAPIFRLQRPAPSPAAPAQTQAEAQTPPAAYAAPAPAPAQDSARYYSVHRQAGRQPDATPMPAPVYLDALPVDLTSMPASTDLAQPPAAPNLIRNANGRLQALPANEDPDLP